MTKGLETKGRRNNFERSTWTSFSVPEFKEGIAPSILEPGGHITDVQ